MPGDTRKRINERGDMMFLIESQIDAFPSLLSHNLRKIPVTNFEVLLYVKCPYQPNYKKG